MTLGRGLHTLLKTRSRLLLEGSFSHPELAEQVRRRKFSEFVIPSRLHRALKKSHSERSVSGTPSQAAEKVGGEATSGSAALQRASKSFVPRHHQRALQFAEKLAFDLL
jgi:hypothetical protein